MENEDRNPVEKIKTFVSDHPVGAIITIVSPMIIGLAAFSGAIQDLCKTVAIFFPPPPTVIISAEPVNNGTALLTFKFFDIPKGRNVDRITLSFEELKPEVGIAGSPSEQVKPILIEVVQLSPKVLEQDNPKLDIEARLIMTPGEPYLLAELPLYWPRKDTTISLRVTPTFFDARGHPIQFEVEPPNVSVTLTNYSTVKPHS